MLRMAGARLSYKSNIPWTVVVPVNHILGRVPQMRTYLEGSSDPTIPFSFARYRGRHFKYGTEDRRGTEGTAGLLFEVNVHIWQFGRDGRLIGRRARNTNNSSSEPWTAPSPPPSPTPFSLRLPSQYKSQSFLSQYFFVSFQFLFL